MDNSMKKKRILISVFLIMAVIAVIALCIMAFGRNNMSSGGLKLEKNTVEWNQEMKSSDEAADIQIPYYSDIYMTGDSGMKNV